MTAERAKLHSGVLHAPCECARSRYGN